MRLMVTGLAALALVVSVPAWAADLPQPAPPPPQAPAAYIPTVAPVYNWAASIWALTAATGSVAANGLGQVSIPRVSTPPAASSVVL